MISTLVRFDVFLWDSASDGEAKLILFNCPMKHFLLIKVVATVLASISLSLASSAQGIRMNGYLGHAFDDYVYAERDDPTQFEGVLEGGKLWGLGIELMPDDEFGFELMFKQLSSRAPMSYETQTGDFLNETFDYKIQYYLLCTNNYLPDLGETLELYGGGMAGLAVFKFRAPEQFGFNSSTKFAYGLRCGANIWVSPFMGLRLQAELISAVQSVSAGFYFDQNGIEPGLYGNSSNYQFNLGGGLVFRFTNY